MDAFTLAALTLACAPLVHASTAQALVAVESSFNQNAIGVVGGVLERQPRNRAEAIATANHLLAAGWNFSAGLSQINVKNFARLGLDTTTAFDPCENLRAMQAVMVECFNRSAPADAPQTALRKALSCYYSGNFVTGFRYGYVQRVASEVSFRRPTAGVPP